MFQESLGRAMNAIDGARACMLIGFDGIPIATVTANEQPESDGLSGVAVEMSRVLGQLASSASKQEIGHVAELSMRTDRFTALARVVMDEYLLIMAVDPTADIDKSTRALRLIAPFVEENM